MRERHERREEVTEVEATKEAATEAPLRDDEFYEAIPYGATQDPMLYDASAYAGAADREGSWLSSVLMLAGIWLILAPYLLNYSTNAASTNDVITGIAVGILAAIGALAATRSRGLSWLLLAAGVWLVAAPFVLGYTGDQMALWNDIISGAVIVALAFWRLQVAGRGDADYDLE